MIPSGDILDLVGELVYVNVATDTSVLAFARTVADVSAVHGHYELWSSRAINSFANNPNVNIMVASLCCEVPWSERRE